MAEDAAGVVPMIARTPIAAGIVLLAAAAAIDLPAQTQTSPPPQTSASSPPAQPGPQRGAGRGRGVQVMTLTTSAWTDGGVIPSKHTQQGGDVSPPLSWTNVPDTTASFVLVFHDLDAASGSGTDDVLHWLMWNIPGSSRSLAEGIPQGPTLPDGSRQISVTGPNYRGPAAPATGPPHHYVFELFALDAMLDVPAIGATPAQTRAAVIAAMAGRVRGKAVYTGLYKRGG